MTELVGADNEGRRWLTPGVAGIGGASLLSDLGHEVPTSLLPSLLTSTLGAPAAALGLIEGVADGLAGVCRLGGGAVADDPERRRAAALGGYTAVAVLSSLIGAATSAVQVGILRAGAWAARGLRVPARNALLADVVPAAAYGRAYGFERAMDNLGAIGGPLLAIGLVSAFGVRGAIGVSVIPGLAATIAILYAIRHTPRPAEQPRRAIRIRVRAVLRGDLGRLMGAISAFELGNCAVTLLILRATQLYSPGGGSASATRTALLLYTGYNLAATAASFPAGRLADRVGNARVLKLGVAAFLAAYIGFALASANLFQLLGAFTLAGAGIGCCETAEHAAVATLAREDIRGSAFGLLAAVQSVGNLVASAVAGLIWTVVSPAAAFGYLAACMAAALVVLTLTRRTTADGLAPG